MHSVCFGYHQGALLSPFVVHVCDGALCGQRPFRGNGVVKNDVLFTVKNTGKINIGIPGHLRQETKHAGNGEARYHLEFLFVAVLQFVKTGPDSQGIEHCIFPGVLLGHRPDLTADGIQI